MNRVAMFAGTLVMLGVVEAAPAQYMQPPVSPYGMGQTASPYINMLHQGNAAVNYMGLVQPQLQTQANFQQMQTAITMRSAPASVAPPRNTGVADTGYAPARFMQFHQYYLTLSGGQQLYNQNVNYQTVPGATSAARFGVGGR